MPQDLIAFTRPSCSDLSEDLEEGLHHYAGALRDPEGNEFDIN